MVVTDVMLWWCSGRAGMHSWTFLPWAKKTVVPDSHSAPKFKAASIAASCIARMLPMG